MKWTSFKEYKIPRIFFYVLKHHNAAKLSFTQQGFRLTINSNQKHEYTYSNDIH